MGTWVIQPQVSHLKGALFCFDDTHARSELNMAIN